VYGTSEAGYATAFLIDDCHALTVQHVFGATSSAVGRRIIFAANVRGSTRKWRWSWATVQADGGLEHAGIDAESRSSDWAVLRLEKCLGKSFGHVRLTSAMPAASDEVALAGFPEDRPVSSGPTVDTGCHVRAVRSAIVLHDCAMLPGNSGSPLVRFRQAQGRTVAEVFAIAEAAHSREDLGRDWIEARPNYPDNVWNIAAVICANERLRRQIVLDCAA
jgi:V8-like Glu-specific endopeptidase